MHRSTVAPDEAQQDTAVDAPHLSQRQIEILGLVTDGRTNIEIATSGPDHKACR